MVLQAEKHEGLTVFHNDKVSIQASLSSVLESYVLDVFISASLCENLFTHSVF